MAGVEVTLPGTFPAQEMARGFSDAVNTQLRDLAIEFQKRMSYYPPWMPWNSTPPKTGPRAGGKRTGNYGRGWSDEGHIRQGRAYVEVYNDVEYARYVGGPHGVQAAALAARDWPSLEDIMDEVVSDMTADGRLNFMPKSMGFA